MKTIEQYIETEMSGIIARKRNSPLPAVLVLVVGVGMLVLMSAARMGDILSATCLTVGLIGTVIGLILTAMNLSGAMTHFVYLPTRSRMREKKVYLGGDDYRDIVEAINNGDFQKLADLMSSAWAAFAHSGNPNTQGLPSWEPYKAENGNMMIFDHTCKISHNPDRHLQQLINKHCFKQLDEFRKTH